MNEDIFNEELVSKLYDPKELGVLHIPAFFSTSAIEEVIYVAEETDFEKMPPSYGRARQDYSEAVLERATIPQYMHEVDTLARHIGTHANFPGVPNVLRANRYDEGSQGIGLHRDIMRQINLIMIGIIHGTAPFYAAKTLDGELTPILPKSRDLIVMRAPRGPGERKNRPYHSVGTCQTNRLTAIARYELPRWH